MADATPVFLNPWLNTVCGLTDDQLLQPEALLAWQWKLLLQTIQNAGKNSSFYRKKLAGLRPSLPATPDDYVHWPTTNADDIQQAPLSFLCVSQGEIDHVVTLNTSGTTQNPKRLFFTESELEQTVLFFHHCLRRITRPGDRIMVLMPSEKTWSVADIFTRALEGLDVHVFYHGLITDFERAIHEICHNNISFLLALPAQALTLCRHPRAGLIKPGQIQRLILSADYVPNAIVQAITETWGSHVYLHWGMTETGYGGAIECRPGANYHLREADFYFEVLHPDTDAPVASGETGELVVTTLRRTAMPLLRYRTGDLVSFITEKCSCGSILKRMNRIPGRLTQQLTVADRYPISIYMLDEVVFLIPEVISYSAELAIDSAGTLLRINAQTNSDHPQAVSEKIRQAVIRLPSIAEAFHRNLIKMDVKTDDPAIPSSSFAIKRKIIDRRNMHGNDNFRHILRLDSAQTPP